MYRLLLLKRIIEDIFIFPFILLGWIITQFKPLKTEYRVFFFFPFYHTGGAEKIHALIALACGGKDCIIYFTKKSVDDRFYQEIQNSSCRIKDISKFTDNKWLYFLNLIYRGIISGYINRQKLKPVVFNGQCNFGYKISPWIKSSIPQAELIHSLNTFSYIRIPFLPFITKTVMISRKRIEDHKELYKKYKIPESLIQRISYIPNAIVFPDAAVSKDDNKLRVLYVGRSTPDKRVWLIAKIAVAVHQVDPDIQFEVAGDVSSVLKSEDHPHIKFHGTIHDESFIHSIYNSAHILLLTSSAEGFPLVVMEAMANGCVVISTAVGDIPYHVKNGENGFLFSNTNNETAIVNEAVEKIWWLKNHPEEMKRISANNMTYARNNFGIERFNNDYQLLFSSLNPQH